jgi:hypothetical protein
MTYTGLCLGGPHDGQYFTADSNVVSTVERVGEDRLLAWPPELLADVYTRRIDYFLYVGHCGSEEFNFWIVASDDARPGHVPENYVIKHLVKNYRPLKKKYDRDTVQVNGKTYILHEIGG